MTIKQARSILGKKADSMSDEQIQKMVNILSNLTAVTINKIMNMTEEEKTELDKKISSQ